MQLRGVILTNHTPTRLRSGASSCDVNDCAVTDCAVTGTTEIINMKTVMMIPHFMFLSVVPPEAEQLPQTNAGHCNQKSDYCYKNTWPHTRASQHSDRFFPSLLLKA